MLPKTLSTIYIHMLASSIPQLSPPLFSKSQIGQEDGAHLPRIHGRRQRQRPKALHHGEDVVLPSCCAERQPGALNWALGVEIPWIWLNKRGERMGSKMVLCQKLVKQLVLTLQKKMV